MQCKRKVIYFNQTCIVAYSQIGMKDDESSSVQLIENILAHGHIGRTKDRDRTWCDHMPSFLSLHSQSENIEWGSFGERPICHTNFPFYWSLNTGPFTSHLCRMAQYNYYYVLNKCKCCPYLFKQPKKEREKKTIHGPKTI